jgi:hypothetical protein
MIKDLRRSIKPAKNVNLVGTSTKGVISYEMTVKKTSTLSFDAKGKLIKNEVKKEKDNEVANKGKKKESKEEED